MTSVSVEWFEEDVEVHFVYRARRVEKGRGVPLLFLHGWPGSFIKGNKKKAFLTQGDENQPTFDVVAPSLPIFGFSGAYQRKASDSPNTRNSCLP
ncbi:hypothetical protein EYB26_007156 [Talaromyces marneffei]|uniref:uncharacterized protein n=1 Tax=Talaromyces marneffei TaxID=37727 RepID=UPI0012A8A0E3|nr:uncharacterized protein EYB26_007156 [Talaromyces marneffei]QGA19467.1 hypothetical protein EYB26_007156 [Talaromyces marneffei]